ncbi:MAG: molybdopterin-dependent oxidoreductase [Bacteroidetes bacterium]|jgi:thiosulfate reductase / polysulfide reductase chain A|nr:molybdopterin-dependent oxidoreductase [Bacteroidota bacterium]MBT3750098.1 molybdopterin-dependent oxidoreductase [Bacteroidota bacterium]MBT4408909.1 molybdopterin-dependent oxidoreductase [Bacteroidota bacterium]MBT5427030.1 molybdopterin-dependent oxidoreductase [Bacteroidota bacterium]MBT7095457.1 molybdopterin-dependent oxidoreductase [Bacteroidota bacterium]
MAKRRDFIKVSALGLGGATLGIPLISSLAKTTLEETRGDYQSMKRTPTYCEVCFWKCAGWVYKNDEGKIWKITGNDEDQHCNGRFCPRGTGGVGMYNDEDRLKTPLIRSEKDGQQTFREASWDEALSYIAKKLKVIAEEHGPECTALFTHGSGGKYFGNLLKAFGSTNITAPSYAQCRGPREVGFIATFGEGVESPERTDIRDARCLVLIGSHLGENMHNGQVQEMSDALDKGANIITVDPRYSTVASKSKFWLPIKPATDLALLLAWIHVIIDEGLYDQDYVKKYTFGFEYLKEHVKNMTPEWAYGITTIKPEIIRETAREMGHASPSVIVHPGRHVTWYGDDTQRLRAVAILNALLGSWGRRGGFYRPETASVPSYPHPPYPEPKRNWRDAFPGQYQLADLALASGICDATIPTVTRDCSFKAWIVNGTNLIETLPNQKNTLEAIKSLELLVVVDTMPMEITGWADVILPECTYLERYDLVRTSPHRKPQIALRMPAVEPKNNTKPAYWIARELSKKMGLADHFPHEKLEDLLDWQLKQMGSSLEEMKKIGVKTFDREYDDLFFLPDEDIEFFTNTGKIELYSSALEAEGFDPMPKYTPHEEPQEGYYRLIYGRAPMHTFSRTSNNPNLTDLMDENKVWINPKVAKEWGLENDQLIHLLNQDGIRSKFPIKVRITERIRWDSVYMVHGFGHDQRKMSRCYGKGASDTNLISRVHIDPVMGGTGMRGNFVTFQLDAEEVKS